MPQVKYIAKGEKTDSVTGVGLRWEPNQVRNVSADVAERLCAFTDTWEIVKGPDTPTGEEIGLRQNEKPTEEPLPVVDFHNMDKQAMIDFAQDKLGVKIPKTLSETNVRHKVTDAFSKHLHDHDEEAAGR